MNINDFYDKVFLMKSNPARMYKNLKDAELLHQTALAAKTEKEATLAFLDYLVEVDERRLYALVNSRSSLFEYLVKDLGFSNPSASERVNTVRLMRSVPLVKEHLESGKLTVTSAAQIQRFVNAEASVHPKGKTVSPEEKEKVVEACLGKSTREVEKTLLEKQTDQARILTQEKIRLITPTRSEIKFTITENTLSKLQELKNLIGNQSLEKIFDEALNALLLTEQKKRGASPKPRDANLSRAPYLEKVKSSSTDSRFIPIDLKRLVFARSEGQCEYVDPATKQRCSSRFRLQIDHRLPLTLNGKTEASNLRHLCFAHNALMAAQAGLYRPLQQRRKHEPHSAHQH